MGVNILGPRQRRKAQRLVGDDPIVQAFVYSHSYSGQYAIIVTESHQHLIWDRKTDEVFDEDPPLTQLSSCRERRGKGCDE